MVSGELEEPWDSGSPVALSDPATGSAAALNLWVMNPLGVAYQISTL